MYDIDTEQTLLGLKVRVKKKSYVTDDCRL